MKRGDRCTLEGGFDAMEEKRFAEATYRWFIAAKSGEAPDDEQYSRMVDASVNCILQQLSDQSYSSREGVSELSNELDRDFEVDILDKLAASLPTVTTKVQLSRLAGEYMFFVLDSYSCHPDIRDMVRILKKANEVMREFEKAYPSMTGSEKGFDLEVRFYIKYTETASERINSRIYREGKERTVQMAQYWSSQSYLPFAEKAVDAAKAYSKIKSGKQNASSRETLANQKMDDFLNSYYMVPIKNRRQ